MTRKRLLIVVVALATAIGATPVIDGSDSIGRLCSYLADAATSLLAIGPTIDYAG